MPLATDDLVYIIWKNVEDNNVDGVKEAVGVFVTNDWAEVRALVEEMNRDDAGVAAQTALHGSPRFGYWRQDVPVLTLKNYKEHLCS